MIPYYLLLLIPVSLQISLKAINKSIRFANSEKKISADNIVLPLFFFAFLMLLSFRSETLGRDLFSYKYIFNIIGQGRLFSNIAGITEPIFQLYNWFIYNFITKNYQLFVSLTAVITVLPIAWVYNQDKSHGYMKSAIFVNMSTFAMLFSGIRQGLAMAVGMLAYWAIKNNKRLIYIVLVLVAICMHHSGFMLIFLWPLYRYRFKKKDLIWLIPFVSTIIIFNGRIFNALTVFLSFSNNKYEAIAQSTGAFSSFILFSLFTIFCYVITDDEKMDDETFALRNILVFSTMLQTFASVNPIAMRLNYYYILLIPIAIGKCLKCVDRRYYQIAKFGEIVICIFFTFYFFYTTYISFITGKSALDIIPYIPFWRKY